MLVGSVLLCAGVCSCSHTHTHTHTRCGVEYIAHAGGCIDGYLYTNSLEAVQQSLTFGVRNIELDLCLTNDNQIVAAHDWGYYNYLTGYGSDDTIALSLTEFQQRRICGKYTPITQVKIDSLMEKNPQMYLVTDKISSPELLARFRFRERIIVECFSLENYYLLDTMGFYKTFYSACPRTYRKAFKKWIKYAIGMSNEKVPRRYVFRDLAAYAEYGMGGYGDKFGAEFAVFDIPNRRAADSLATIDNRIRYVYIDDTSN